MIQNNKILTQLIATVEKAPFSILITDKNHKIIYANRFLLSQTHYSFEELYNKTPKIFSTEYNEKFYPELRQKISQGKIWEGVFLNKKKDGTKYWEYVYIVPLIENDEIVNFVAYKQDITEKKAMEEKLLEAKIKAEEAAKVKSEFLANMSHEIRTPINGIIGFIDLLLEQESDPQKRKYLEIVKDSSHTLLNLINDILDYSKLESQKMEFEILNFNVRDLIIECINSFKLRASQKGLNLTYFIDNNIPQYVKGDKLRILQVLNNLVSNAIKFTENGYVKICVEMLEKMKDSVKLKFTVEDTGIGIEKERLNKIFDAFYQTDPSITRKFGGTGLGLAISKEIISNLNGEIYVESQKNKGSKFYFILTFPIGEEIFISPKIQEKDIDLSSLKILIAEDNEFNQEFFREIFELLKINAEVVSNGMNVLEKLANNNYDAIFLDIHMPVLNGIETAKIIRKLEKGEEIKTKLKLPNLDEKLKDKSNIIIALTGESYENIKTELFEAGFNDYLFKPFKIEELIDILKKNIKVKTFYEIEDLINLKALDQIIGENEELRETLIKIFIDNCREIINEIENALNQNNKEELNKIIHKLKGTSGNIKAEKIYNLALDMQRSLIHDNMQKFILKLEKLKRYINNLNF